MNKLPLSVMIAALLAGCSTPLPHSNEVGALAAEPSVMLPLRNDIQHGQLANGLKYMVLPNAEPADRVSLQLIVHAGSLDEADDQKGIAHLVEHMAFNGTEQFPANRIIEHQESLGLVFGRDVNAMTEYYTTSYYLHLNDNSEPMLDQAFNMFAQQVSALLFDPQQLENERPVVEEEWRLGLNMMARLGTANRQILLAGSRFGERDPIGDMDLVRQIGAERIKAFYNDWYHPNNMTLLVIGSVDKAQIEAKLNQYFAAMPAQNLPARPKLSVPLASDLQFDTIEDNEITTEVLSVNLRTEQPVVHSEAGLKQELLNRLVMTMIDNRLRVQYQTESPYISRMVASAMPLAVGYRNDRVMAILKDGQYVQGMQELFAEISRYAAHGFSQQDLDTARNGLLARQRTMAQGQEDADNRRLMMGIFNQIRMQRPLVDPRDLYQATERQLSQIHLEEVNQHFQHMVQQRVPLVIAQINRENRHAMPTTAQIDQLWQQALAAPPPPLLQQNQPTQLFVNAPAPTEIVDHQQEGDIHKWTLANGAQVWFQRSDERNSQVQLRWQGYGGTSLLPLSERQAARLAVRNLSTFGYGGFDPEALASINASHNLRQMPYVDLTRQGISGSTSRDSLEIWLQNLNLMLTHPQVDQAIWQAKQIFTARNLDQRQHKPSALFNEQIDQIRYVNTPSMQPMTGEQVRAVTAEQMLTAYQQIFGTAAGHQLVVLGDIEPEQVIDLVSRYLGHLPAGVAHQESPLPKLAQGKHRVLVSGGEEPQGLTSVLFNADYPFSDEAEDQADLLSRIVSLRLREQLREQAAGVYTTRFGIRLDRPRQQAFGMLSYSHDPERAEELKAMAFAIIADVAANGVTDAELNTVRAQLLSRLQPEAITDQDRYRWLSEMAANNQFDDHARRYQNWLNRISAHQLQPLARTILSTGNVIDALLIPEKHA